MQVVTFVRFLLLEPDITIIIIIIIISLYEHNVSNNIANNNNNNNTGRYPTKYLCILCYFPIMLMQKELR